MYYINKKVGGVVEVNNVVFTWKSLDDDLMNFGNMKKLEIIFKKEADKPIIYIDTGFIKIEDRTFEIDSKEVLKKIKELDLTVAYDKYSVNEYAGNGWELIVNDKKYEGILEDPIYVSKIKKIIRFNAIQVYANKKLAGYIKS